MRLIDGGSAPKPPKRLSPLRFAPRSSVSLLAISAVVLSSNVAHAEGETKTDEKKEEKKEGANEEEKRGAVDLEVVIGGGKVDAINPIANGLTGQIGYERRPTDVIASGIVLSGRWDVSKSFNLGMRIPIVVATLRPADDLDRTIANLGNVELEAEYEKELNEHVEFFMGAHIALPTSFGNELPSEATLATDPASVDPIASDKFSANKAVGSAYGFENNALWLAGYLGIIPAIGVKLRFGPVRIEPYVKLENMFSVRPESEERAIVELDVGGRVAVQVASIKSGESKTRIDVGARVWGSFTLTDHEGDLNIGVVEPEVRVGGDKWRVTAGVLVPFAGELTDPQWISGRLSATVVF